MGTSTFRHTYGWCKRSIQNLETHVEKFTSCAFWSVMSKIASDFIFTEQNGFKVKQRFLITNETRGNYYSARGIVAIVAQCAAVHVPS